ncbi:putative acyl-activating enzyme 17, peroxisomal [Platanthera guangdongensis]|uniref:Acyl-activating enzyme 17, peroxisomal n=1 Tax=Platanthera guangdongensis TaxID=2320717 RepID=A0ABR2LTJ5_9ASPA
MFGASMTLLNADHYDVYFKGMPLWKGTVLRRHGDLLELTPEGYYRAHGRADDTMNLGGIKFPLPCAAAQPFLRQSAPSLKPPAAPLLPTFLLPCAATQPFLRHPAPSLKPPAALLPTVKPLHHLLIPSNHHATGHRPLLHCLQCRQSHSHPSTAVERKGAVGSSCGWVAGMGETGCRMIGGEGVSSVEIERICDGVDEGILETAAIGVPPAGGGPEQLFVAVVFKGENFSSSEETLDRLKAAFNAALQKTLNPLFRVRPPGGTPGWRAGVTPVPHQKVSVVVAVPSLPRTASNKVMRRVLRQQFLNLDARRPKF